MSAFNTNTAISFTNNNNNPQGNEIEFERISHTLNSLIKHFLLENVNNFNEDPFEEFFVACDPNVEEEDLWQSKYKIRKDMQPTFISSLLAKKIFSIGKSLNFIRYSCNDNDWIINNAKPTGADKILKYGDIIGLETFNCYKTIFTAWTRRFHSTFNGLSKPANTLYRHNLTGTLEAAIRASNAQYDDPDILRRLDVRLLEDELYNFTIKELMHRENINIVSEIRQGKSRNLGDTDEEKSSFLSDDSKEKLKPIQARFNEIAGFEVVDLLTTLAHLQDTDLRFLNVRLDFNEFYSNSTR
ncbi:4264_t:CDS:2 [Entrophospora sp. SA101]|nr:4264_t:CDS:2 [Entrophospora sp. SA101]